MVLLVLPQLTFRTHIMAHCFYFMLSADEDWVHPNTICLSVFTLHITKSSNLEGLWSQVQYDLLFRTKQITPLSGGLIFFIKASKRRCSDVLPSDLVKNNNLSCRVSMAVFLLVFTTATGKAYCGVKLGYYSNVLWSSCKSRSKLAGFVVCSNDVLQWPHLPDKGLSMWIRTVSRSRSDGESCETRQEVLFILFNTCTTRVVSRLQLL